MGITAYDKNSNYLPCTANLVATNIICRFQFQLQSRQPIPLPTMLHATPDDGNDAINPILNKHNLNDDFDALFLILIHFHV